MNQAPPPDGQEILLQALELHDLGQFEEFLAEHPAILGADLLGELDRMRNDPVGGPAFEALAELFQRASDGNPKEAWNTYQLKLRQTKELAHGFQAGVDEIEAALKTHDADRAIERATELLPRVRETGLMLMEGLLHEARGRALLERTSGDHSENLELAIADFHAAVLRAPDDSHRAMVLMHAGLAFRERVRFDRGRNLDQAVMLFREALDLLDPSAPPDLWAILRTNLASTLLGAEGDGRVERLHEAADLCRQALDYRSPTVDAVDWAHTQINLAFILQDLALLNEGDIEIAKAAFEEVILEADRIVEEWLVGAAHCALGRLELIASERSAEEREAAMGSPEEGRRQRKEEMTLLESARKHLETGLPLTETDWLPTRRGRALNDLADVLSRLERPDLAIPVGREALAILRPTTTPRECLSVGGRLGDQLATLGNWEEAAEAFEDALEAAELSFHGRLETEGREDEARRAGELARWAAMAFARVGRPKDATLALESGRTRELRRRLHLNEAEKARLDALPDNLREAFVSASAALAASPLDDTASSAARVLQEVLEEIRRLPGMADFATGPSWEDVVTAVEPGWPLVYVNPTPWGTLLLRVSKRNGEAQAETLILDGPSSLDVYYRLALGSALDPDSPASLKPSSYLAAIAAEGAADLKESLEQVLPWLGELICQPLTEWIEGGGNTGVTLIPCGPISVAPLGAALWAEGESERCMLDTITVRYAPSALLGGVARARAAKGTGEKPCLLALADPDRSLDAAEPEVGEIATHFEGRHTVASGADATSEFLRSELTGVTHLHFACHAQAGVFDTIEPGIMLADGLLPAQELTALDGLSSRLAVISACQSAIPQISRLPNEVFATSTALLAAGSACVVASLWPVNDGSTGMLITRFYEEMFEQGLDPPEALRRAQLWLRDLTEEGRQDFLDAHPIIGAEIRRREISSKRRGRVKGAGAPGRPYSHPDDWAPFIAVGA